MSYTLYRSPAIVIGHSPYGESDRTVILLTRDHGLIRARVQNARSESSRLRYGAQFLAYGEFEYVRGRYTWRLVGAHNIRYPKYSYEMTPQYAQICGDLIRLVQGEEPCEDIFEILHNLLFVNVSSDACDVVIARATILNKLGYVDPESLPETCDATVLPRFIQIIERGLASAHL